MKKEGDKLPLLCPVRAIIDGDEVQICTVRDIQDAVEDLAPLLGSYFAAEAEEPASGCLRIKSFCVEDAGNERRFVAQAEAKSEGDLRCYSRVFTQEQELVQLYTDFFAGNPIAFSQFQDVTQDSKTNSASAMEGAPPCDESRQFKVYLPIAQDSYFSVPDQPQEKRSTSAKEKERLLKEEREAYARIDLTPLEQMVGNVVIGHVREDGIEKLQSVAEYYYAQGDYEAARDRFLRVAALLDDDFEASDIYHQLGGCFFYLNNEDMKTLCIKKAIEIVRLHENELDRDDYLLRCAFELNMMGFYRIMLVCLDQLSNRDNMEWFALRYGEAYSNLGEHRQAVRWLTKGLNKQGTSLEVYWLLGWNFARLGQTQKALVYLEQMRRLKTDDPRVYLELGSIYLSQKQYRKAFDCYEACLNYVDASDIQGRGFANMMFGYSCLMCRKKRRALAAMQEAYEAGQRTPSMLRNMAVCLRLLARAEEASAFEDEAKQFEQTLDND